MDPKKRSVGASARDELFLRAPWRLMVAGQTHTERLLFVDECSTNTSLAPLWHPSTLGPGQESERFVRCRATGGLRSPSVGEHERGRDGPVLALEGPTTREVFKTYLKRVLAPSLRPGQVIVMDNLSSHK